MSNYSSANLNLPFKYSFSLSPSFCHQSFPLSLSLAPFLGNAHQRKPIYTVKGPLIAAVVISSQGWWSRRSGDGFVAGVVDFMVLLYLSSPIWVLWVRLVAGVWWVMCFVNCLRWSGFCGWKSPLGFCGFALFPCDLGGGCANCCYVM